MADGSLDWLDKASSSIPTGEDCGYGNFMSTIDLLIMGRNSYEKVLSFGGWPYEKLVIVLSSRNLEIPEELKHRVYPNTETPEELCIRIWSPPYMQLKRRLTGKGLLSYIRSLNERFVLL